ncbi:MAG: efflux RND transporter periplasmic adaptor subunit [Ferrimonas sp.]
MPKTYTHVASAVLLLTASACAFAAPPRGPQVANVYSSIVSEHSVAPSLTVVGTLSAVEGVMISPQIGGRIAQILVQSNQQVEQGQLLLRLDDAAARAALAEAKAYQADEKRKLAEVTRLRKTGAVTQSEIEAQQASVYMADARVQAAEVQRQYHELRAPFAGTIGLIDYSVGALVSSGDELLSLDNLQELRLDLAIPERYLGQLGSGLVVIGSSRAYPEQQFIGHVESVSSRVSSSSLNVVTRARFNNDAQQLKPGMMLSAQIEFAAVAQAMVPVQALEYAGTKRFVYVLDNDDVAHRTEVQLGRRLDTMVAIESGLPLGARIAVQGLVGLRDGIKVNDQAKQYSSGGSPNMREPSNKQEAVNAAF